MVRPGDTIHARGWEIRREGLAAVAEPHEVTFQLFDPRGAVAAEKKVNAEAGGASVDFTLGKDVAGGAWVLRATSALGVVGERGVVVSTYELPRLQKSLAFAGQGYRGGDAVMAVATVARTTGEPVSGGRVLGLVTLDGAEVARLAATTTRKGVAALRFRLPQNLGRGDVLLTVIVDGEAIQRRVPVAVGETVVDFFPEGGDLVADVPGRVYFAARTPLGEPADVRGRIVDDEGAVLAEVASFHRGMGRFGFTPRAGRTYRLELDDGEVLPLPGAHAGGCTFAVEDDFESKAPHIALVPRCKDVDEVLAVAVLREELVAHATAKNGERVALPLPAAAQGAVRVTIFARDGRPLAERLVYRGRGRDLSVELAADRDSYEPGDTVTLAVTTRDAAGRPAAADLALAVVDEALLSLANDRTAHILAQLYLLPEMPGQEIEDASFYFGADPKAPRAMDLLLGTRGWRRFAFSWN